LLVRVRELKTRRSGKTFAMTDGGMQNIAFPLSYEYHECLLATGAEGRSRRRYFVTGPLCSSEDILYRNWKLPELKEGDILAIMDAGAYFTSFANNFSFARPAVVAVSNGTHTVLRRRETFDHMSAVDEFLARHRASGTTSGRNGGGGSRTGHWAPRGPPPHPVFFSAGAPPGPPTG